MEFRTTDHASEKQLKLDVIAAYNQRLDEREKRKRFVIEHNLLDYKKNINKKMVKVSLGSRLVLIWFSHAGMNSGSVLFVFL